YGDKALAPSLMAHVDEHAPPLPLYVLEGCFQLGPAVAPEAPEHLAREALGVDPDQDGLAVVHLALDQGDVVFPGSYGLVAHQAEGAVLGGQARSEEHTSELQSRENLV